MNESGSPVPIGSAGCNGKSGYPGNPEAFKEIQ